jgi:hypothetical protein
VPHHPVSDQIRLRRQAVAVPNGPKKEEKRMLWKGFQKPKRLAMDSESLTDKYGHFWAQPFERGFGTTIGNALRRSNRFPVSSKMPPTSFLT